MAQLMLVALLRSPRGAAVVIGVFLLGMFLGKMVMDGMLAGTNADVLGFTAKRHILCSGVCGSGAALGFGGFAGAGAALDFVEAEREAPG